VTTTVVDASALAALVFQEPNAEIIAKRLNGASLAAPSLLRFELANVACKKMRVHPAGAVKIVECLIEGLEIGRRIAWHEVDHSGVVLIAQETGLSTYDASYLWLAGWLGADLVTLDTRLANAGTL
jgi:predicted nucleic acid-binding protein